MPVFNKACAKFFLYHGGAFRSTKEREKMARESPAKHLDSYVLNTEIVSRKYAQLNEVSEETAIVR